MVKVFSAGKFQLGGSPTSSLMLERADIYGSGTAISRSNFALLSFWR